MQTGNIKECIYFMKSGSMRLNAELVPVSTETLEYFPFFLSRVGIARCITLSLYYKLITKNYISLCSQSNSKQT